MRRFIFSGFSLPLETVNESSLLPPEGLVITQILQNHWHGFLKAVPSIFIGIVVLFVTWGLAHLGSKVTRILIRRKLPKSVLQDIVARGVGILIFLFGIYLIFEMSNLTGAALTVISGTGLLGIILGIAFRDITENFLASVLLSIHNPFQNGDLVEIGEFTGYVQGLTLRVTLLMSLDGNHIQIPNSIVYKSSLRNFSSNSSRREEFSVGISYDNAISKTQEVILKVLEKHEALLKDPEPNVLVEALGKTTITLRILFWFDGSQHNSLKVRSSVIRLVRRAFQEEGISMPGEMCRTGFPNSLSISKLAAENEIPKPPPFFKEPQSVVTDCKSQLRNDAKEFISQAKQTRPPEKGTNLLD